MKPRTRRYYSAITAAISLSPAVLSATDSTWGGTTGALTANTNDSAHSWSTATNWNTNPAIPNSAGDSATFSNTLTGNLTVYLNGGITLGSLKNLDTNNEITIQNGTGGSITFNTGSSTVPSIDVSARTGGVGLLLYATINGSNGLDITGSASTGIRFNGSSDWAGFSGGLAVKQGLLAPQAGNYNYSTFAVSSANKVLPTDERLTLGATGTTDFNLSSGRDLAVGSLAGTSSSYIYNTSTGTSFAVLAVGNDNSSGAVFAGTIGNNSGNTTSANLLHLHKIGSGTQEIAGKITGPGNVVVNNGTLHLSNSSNNNDYTGTTTVNSGATLKIGSANALGNTSGATSVASGATLDLNGQTTGETIASIAGTGVGGLGALVNGNTSSAASVTTDIVNPGNLVIGGAGDTSLTRIRSSGVFTVTKLGAGKLTTNGSSHNNLSSWDIQAGKVVFANTSGYGADRGVAINGGTLQLSGSNSNLVNDGQAFTINSGTFDLNGKSEAVAPIGGSGGTITNSAASTTSNLYLGGGPSGTSSASYGGVIENGAGTIKLTKEGSGTQTLSGTNTYTGATTINGGTLALGATGSIDNTSEVSLGSSGTFDVSAKTGGYSVSKLTGSGNVIGSLSVTTQLAIGNSPGTTSFDNLTLGSASIYTYELTGGGTTADLGLVEGTLTLASGAILDLIQLGSYTASDKFTLFSYTGTLVGTFSGLADGATFTDAGGIWQIDYNDGSTGLNGGNLSGASYITITAVPEPRAAFLGMLGLLMLLRRRIR